jgi:hypothetical protein
MRFGLIFIGSILFLGCENREVGENSSPEKGVGFEEGTNTGSYKLKGTPKANSRSKAVELPSLSDGYAFRNELESWETFSLRDLRDIWNQVDQSSHADSGFRDTLVSKMLEIAPPQDVLKEVQRRYGEDSRTIKLLDMIFDVVSRGSPEGWGEMVELLKTEEATKEAIISLFTFTPNQNLESEAIFQFASNLPDNLKKSAFSKLSQRLFLENGPQRFAKLVEEKILPKEVAKNTFDKRGSSIGFSKTEGGFNLESNLSRYEECGLIDLSVSDDIRLLARATRNESDEAFWRLKSLLEERANQEAVRTAVDQRAKDLVYKNLERAVTFSGELENPAERDIVIRHIIRYANEHGEIETAKQWESELSGS